MFSFQPNCTFPVGPAFVKAPNIRSTMDIVWTCLSVIGISTWSALHLNTPPHIRPQTLAERIRFTVFLLSRKLKGVVMVILLPEVAAGLAAKNLKAAWLN